MEEPARKPSRKRKAEEHVNDVVTSMTGEPTKQKRHPTLYVRPVILDCDSDDEAAPPAPKTSTSGHVQRPLKKPSVKKSSTSKSSEPTLAELVARMKKYEDALKEKDKEIREIKSELVEVKEKNVVLNTQVVSLVGVVDEVKEENRVLAKENEKIKRRSARHVARLKNMDMAYDENSRMLRFDKEGFHKYRTFVKDDEMLEIEDTQAAAGSSAQAGAGTSAPVDPDSESTDSLFGSVDFWFSCI